jgi:hypothetical protein
VLSVRKCSSLCTTRIFRKMQGYVISSVLICVTAEANLWHAVLVLHISLPNTMVFMPLQKSYLGRETLHPVFKQIIFSLKVKI